MSTHRVPRRTFKRIIAIYYATYEGTRRVIEEAVDGSPLPVDELLLLRLFSAKVIG